MGILYEKVMKMRESGRSFVPKKSAAVKKNEFAPKKKHYSTVKEAEKDKEAVVKDDNGTTGKS